MGLADTITGSNSLLLKGFIVKQQQKCLFTWQDIVGLGWGFFWFLVTARLREQRAAGAAWLQLDVLLPPSAGSQAASRPRRGDTLSCDQGLLSPSDLRCQWRTPPPRAAAAHKVAGLQQCGEVPMEGSPSGASGRSSLHFPLLVHRWRRRVKILEKTGLSAPFSPCSPRQSPADCRYFYFVACFTSVESIEFSARKGVKSSCLKCRAASGEKPVQQHLPFYPKNSARPAENRELCLPGRAFSATTAAPGFLLK